MAGCWNRKEDRSGKYIEQRSAEDQTEQDTAGVRTRLVKMGKGAMGCGTKCSRFTLVTLNVIFLLCGTAFLVLGGVFRFDIDQLRSEEKDSLGELCGTAFIVLGGVFRFGSDKLKSEVKDSLSEVEIGNYNLYQLSTNLAVIFMVAGGIMILFSALGFIGACCMSRCALVLYCILVGLVLVLELAGVILFFIMKSKFEDGVRTGLQKSISMANDNNEKKDIREAQQKSLEYLFKEFECCQVNGKRLTDPGSATATCLPGTEAHDKDCVTALEDWIKHYQTAFIAIGICVILIEIMLITCACMVFRAAGKDY